MQLKKKLNQKRMTNKILIVIPVYNGVERFLDDCLSSLQGINFPSESFDVLAIDDLSADNSAEYIKEHWPKTIVIKNENNLGFAKSNNVGLQYAIDNGYEYVYLLNQDTGVDQNFLSEAIGVMNSDVKIGAVQSKLMLFYDREKINSWGNEIHFLGFAYAGGYKVKDFDLPVREIAYPSGACVLIKTSALKYVGFFNEEFYMYHEDVDLGWRLWLAGYSCVLAPKSIVYHKYEFSRSIKKFYFMERNRYLVVLQNYKSLTLLLLAPAMILMDLMMFVYSFYGGWWRQEIDVYKYFFRTNSMVKLAKTRHEVQKMRRVSDREIIKRFTGKIDFQDFNNPILIYLVNPFFSFYLRLIKFFIWW